MTLGGYDDLAGILGEVYSESGFVAAVQSIARKRLERLNERVQRGEYIPAAHFARAYLRSGETEQAFRRLEEAREERNAYPLLMKSDPFYDGLRAHPRFAAILKSMNLE